MDFIDKQENERKELINKIVAHKNNKYGKSYLELKGNKQLKNILKKLEQG